MSVHFFFFQQNFCKFGWKTCRLKLPVYVSSEELFRWLNSISIPPPSPPTPFCNFPKPTIRYSRPRHTMIGQQRCGGETGVWTATIFFNVNNWVSATLRLWRDCMKMSEYLRNACVMCTMIIKVSFVGQQSLLYVILRFQGRNYNSFFPPWVKRRVQKRRVLNESVKRQLHHCLTFVCNPYSYITVFCCGVALVSKKKI